MEVLAY